MALTDFLTQIADSIRSKDGTTDTIKATDFPQRILDIPSGGGSEIIKTNGSFTLSEDSRQVTIEHNLGVIPNIINIYPSDNVPISASVVYDDTHIYFPDNNINTGVMHYNGKASMMPSGYTPNSTSYISRGNASNRAYTAGATYYWEAWGGIKLT